MNILTKAALGVAMSGALAVPALAGGYSEPVAEAPVAAPVAPAPVGADWTGGYVGAQIGYGDVSAGASDGDGATYGLRGGYDWDLGNWVVGAGVDWDQTDIDLGGGPDKLDSIARLKLRAGYDLGRTMVYGTAGAARAEADLAGVGHSDNGWFAGLGAEYALNDRWTLGGEVLHNQFDDFDNTGIDLDATTAAINVGFRF
ncbi:MAG: hypothetical protein B7Z02_00830 [Rhodobacterales bacterium 32-67-9]|nr:MAG: hypothetical protein B7Z02_00830 [Rhodobacterales bacterium 32-67-9]